MREPRIDCSGRSSKRGQKRVQSNASSVLLLVVYSLCFASLPWGTESKLVSFSIEDFQLRQLELLCLGSSAKLDDSTDHLRIPFDIAEDDLTSRVVYRNPIEIKEKDRFSFRTNFTFRISGNSRIRGDGMAFLIAPTCKAVKGNSTTAGALGMLDLEIKGYKGDPDLKFVAVEFDTKRNEPWDNNDNHVGLNVNSVKSINETDLGLFGINLRGGDKITTWIDYYGDLKVLTVRMAKPNDKVHEVLRVTDFELSSYVDKHSYVGFCAAAGGATEYNEIYGWHFTSYPECEKPESPGESTTRSSCGAKGSSFNWHVLIYVMAPTATLLATLLATIATICKFGNAVVRSLNLVPSSFNADTL